MILVFISALLPLSKAQGTVNPNSVTAECLQKLRGLTPVCVAEVKFWGEKVSASNESNQKAVAFCNNFDAISACISPLVPDCASISITQQRIDESKQECRSLEPTPVNSTESTTAPSATAPSSTDLPTSASSSTASPSVNSDADPLLDSVEEDSDSQDEYQNDAITATISFAANPDHVFSPLTTMLPDSGQEGPRLTELRDDTQPNWHLMLKNKLVQTKHD